MPWAHSDVLDNGPAYIKANATKAILVSTYAAGDSYATVQANKLAETAMVNADFTLAANGANRRLTTAAGKTGAATATVAAGNDLYWVFTDGAAKVLWATDETTNMAVTTGNTITFPSLTYNSNQPT